MRTREKEKDDKTDRGGGELEKRSRMTRQIEAEEN